MIIAIFVGLLLILFLMGVAVPYALIATSVVGMIYSGGFGRCRWALWRKK